MTPSADALFTPTTIFSLLSTVLILFASYLVTSFSLPRSRPALLHLTPLRPLLLWHTFDGLTHLFLELPFVYHSLFTLATPSQVASHKDAKYLLSLPYYPRISGADFSTTSPLAALWQEYAKADSRWGWAEPSIVAVEMITAIGGGSLALYISAKTICLAKNARTAQTAIQARDVKKRERNLWFCILVLAVCEVYGCWMTFGPEWLVGSPHLNTSNWMYLWLYLAFFNVLWVVVPLWLVYKSWEVLVRSSTAPPEEKKKN